MRNAAAMLAVAFITSALVIGLLLGSMPRRVEGPPRPNLEQIDFWTPTMNELADEDPEGFAALPRPGDPGFDEQVEAWCYQTRQTIYTRRFGRPYNGLPTETR